MKAFRVAVRLHNVRFRLHLGELLADLGTGGARSKFYGRPPFSPKQLAPQISIGDLLDRMGRYNAAIAAYKQALALDPHNAPARSPSALLSIMPDAVPTPAGNGRPSSPSITPKCANWHSRHVEGV